MPLVILGMGLAVAIVVFAYRRVQQTKRAAAAAYKAALDEADRARAEAIRTAELERVRAEEQRRAVAEYRAKRAEEQQKALTNKVVLELGVQEEALRHAATTCAHRDRNDPVPAFLAHGGAALILKFNAPWAELFSLKHYPVILANRLVG